MIDPYTQVREQRALDVADGLLGRHFRRREDMHFAHRVVVTTHDTDGDNAWQRTNEVFCLFPDRHWGKGSGHAAQD